ncbi:hypothetical protein [Methylobacterium flocculans]|jgi:hypothetical protein|uniref:hypothetical protein n=1 Tax=Methylobacterium flocculans TaxID=2984843 RepID=UPI0021F36CE8|nr:hypothetical protein [Methylobacterium sp. FF17]
MTAASPVTAFFSSLDGARAARQRLASAGFARNSIDIERQGDRFLVLINVRDEHRARAEELLARSPVAHSLRRSGGQAAAAFQDNRLLALSLAGLAGFAAFGLLRRR